MFSRSVAKLFLMILQLSTAFCISCARAADRLTPTVADLPYAHESERQKLDFWRADSEAPAPVVIMIHGGGWISSDKTRYEAPDIKPLLDVGISVASINYRFIGDAMEQGIEPPVKACIHDAARALQTIRANARRWNVDPRRIGATGSSAGACTALWLALHDDLAEPDSTDPIARESSRLQCVAVVKAQTSLDPKQLREWIPNSIYGGHAFGFSAEGRDWEEEFALLVENRQRVLPWIKEYSPIEHVSNDDPPIFFDYPGQKTPPVLGQPEPDPTHSAIQGEQLANKMRKAGVEARVSYPGHEDPKYHSVNQFLIDKLTASRN